uniref:Copper type II ascorbate-dependent monooxygenase C-terminal domain-containing protein n=1 Tax=Arion vulgaris TaxID=1028688 RepID=A0A0B7A301_9EUPU
MMIVSLCFVVALSVQCVTSYMVFQNRIPNGKSIPFPCKKDKTWLAAGHILDEGTGARNNFGLDFAQSGFTWTESLCRKDSDGDGMSNGEELGDPYCVWTENDLPSRTTGLSHPGICEPWESPACMKKTLTGSMYPTQKEWMESACKSDGLDCPALNDTNVRNVSVRITPGSKIPPQETTYACQIFDLNELGLPLNQDFHMIGVEPIIDNRNVLHHMVLFGCTDATETTSEYYECGMIAAESCQDFLHVWAVGLDGECYHNQSGVKIGINGYKKVALQNHWNNPTLSARETDSSGLRVYYTPKLRTYDAGVLMVGSINFYLPPKKQDIALYSACTGTCTKQAMRGSINITSAWNHMHYAGYRMSIHVTSKTSGLTYLTNEKMYSYDSPQVQLFPTPFELMPGDAIITNCGFNTMNRNTTTVYGEATNDEMCFGFITYYPKQNWTEPFCADQAGISFCDPQTYDGCPRLGVYMQAINTTEVYRELSKVCKTYAPCLEECRDTIVKYMLSDGCLQGNVWGLLQNTLAKGDASSKNFLSLLSSCKVEVYLALNPSITVQVPDTPTTKPAQYNLTPMPNRYCSDSAFAVVSSILLLAFSAVTAHLWN